MWSVVLACAAVLALVMLIAQLHAATRELAAHGERVKQLTARLDAVEEAAARAAAQADVAESVLVEKGIADEEDIEAARQRYDADEQSRYVRDRDGALH